MSEPDAGAAMRTAFPWRRRFARHRPRRRSSSTGPTTRSRRCGIVDGARSPDEIARFETALIATRAQILEMQQRIAESIGAKDASIFDAHLLVVEDRTLIDEVLRTLQRDRFNVEHVFASVAGRYAKTLSEIDDPYLRERALDIHDVTRRVIHNLMGKERPRPRQRSPRRTSSSRTISRRPTPRSSTASSCSASPPTSAARPRTPRSWRGR